MITVSTSLSKKYHHGDLRGALLEAALSILEAGGDPNTLSLREAARRAGVSAMAPYRHFADKDALLAGVAAIGFARFTAALRAADDKTDAHEALIAQGVAYVDFALANPALFRLMFGARAPKKTAALAEAQGASYAVLADRVASIAPPATVADRTLACWSLVHGLASLALDGKLEAHRESAPVLAERMLRLLALGEAGHDDRNRQGAENRTLKIADP